MAGRLWTISNLLSFLRIVLILPIVLLLVSGQPADRLWAVALMAAAALTDAFDGLLARALNQVTDFGKIFDPLADKVTVAVIVVVLVLQGEIPTWFLVMSSLRDVAILGGGIYVKKRVNIVLQSNTLGKWTVTVVAAYIIAATLDVRFAAIETVLLAASAVMIVVSFGVYIQRFLEITKAAS